MVSIVASLSSSFPIEPRFRLANKTRPSFFIFETPSLEQAGQCAQAPVYCRPGHGASAAPQVRAFPGLTGAPLANPTGVVAIKQVTVADIAGVK